MIIAMLALALASSPGAPCALSTPQGCRDTNQPAWSPGFDAAIHAFLGMRRAAFVGNGGAVADQAIEVLGGPPDDPARIGPYWRFTACRAHECEDKGALVVNPAGTIIAIAILHSACSLPHPGNDCYAHDTLTIYTRHAGPDVIRDLKEWGAAQVGGASVAGLRPTTLDAVEVVPV